MLVTERYPRENGREYAVRIIRQNIISMDLKPGLIVSEKQLASELGLSRTPVREALIELSKVQIVDILAQIGSRISLIDMDMVHESIFLRKLLEKAIVELACDMMTEQYLNELKENIKLQEFYLENPSSSKILELDDAFHRKLFEICKKERVYSFTQGMTIHFDRVRNLRLITVKDVKVVADHRYILEAICRKDKEFALQKMDEHLMRYRFDEEQLRNEHPEYYK